MNLAFELTMPHNSAWNGRWSGEGKPYVVVRAVRDCQPEIVGKTFYHDFGDGWGANVSVQLVTGDEAKRLRGRSAGFCGYDWMIADILAHGRILTAQERSERRAVQA